MSCRLCGIRQAADNLTFCVQKSVCALFPLQIAQFIQQAILLAE